MKYIFIVLSLFLLISCNQKEKPKSMAGGMKCGAGKCGASQSGGSTSLSKKRINILKQLKKDDNRSSCVKSAKTIKKLYDCVRDKESGRLRV